MKVYRYLLLIVLPVLCKPQYLSQTYPDPRFDVISCRIVVPGTLCDLDGIIPDLDRYNLAQQMNELNALTASTANISPACKSYPDKALQVFVAITEKIGLTNWMTESSHIEKFADNLKRRYQNFQDSSMCDLLVLIVNSRKDHQVYTVAGKDTKLSKSILQEAFDSNIEFFKADEIAKGMNGMVDFIVNSYIRIHIDRNEHLPQPSPSTGKNSIGMRGRVQTYPNVRNFPQRHEFTTTESQRGKESHVNLDENDNLWVELAQQAIARCGNNRGKLGQHVRSIVEESLSISYRLLSDERYNMIEKSLKLLEETTSLPQMAVRNQIWKDAEDKLNEEIFRKYLSLIESSILNRCPTSGDFQQYLRDIR